MEFDLDTLSQETERLGARLAEQAEALCAEASRLRQEGAPPGGELILALQRTRGEFLRLEGALREALAADCGEAAAELPSLEALRQALGRLLAAREARRAALGQAREILERVGRLGSTGDAAVPGLAAAQGGAGRLLRTIGERSPQVRQLLTGAHPLAALLRLVAADLDDERWNELQEIVAGALGRPLAARAARGGLALRTAEPTAPAPIPAAPAPPGAGGPIAAAPPASARSPLPPAPEAGVAVRHLCQLLRQGRFGLAAHLGAHFAAQAQAADPGAAPPLDPALLRTLALSSLVRSGCGDLVEAFTQALRELPPLPGSAPARGAERLLRFALCLRPALLAPGSGVAAALPELGAGPLADLGAALRAYLALGLPLSPGVVRGVRDPASWPHVIEDLVAQHRRFRVLREEDPLPCAASTAIWHRWLEDSGALYPLLVAVARDDRARADEVRALVRAVESREGFRRLAEETDRSLRGAAAALAPLPGPSLLVLRGRCDELLRLARRWLTMCEARGMGTLDGRYGEAERAWGRVALAVEEAEAELQSLIAAQEELDAAAAAAALIAVRDLEDCLSRDDERPIVPPRAIGTELIHVSAPALQLDEDWSPVPGDARLDEALPELLAGERAPALSFLRHLSARDHLGTARVLDLLADRDETEAATELGARRQEAITECRARLQGELSAALGEIERAAADGILDEEGRLLRRARLAALDPAGVLVFPAAEAQLERDRRDLQAERAARAWQAERAAGPRDPAEEVRALRELFPRFIREAAPSLEAARRAEGVRQILADVAERRPVGPLRLQRLSAAEAASAAAFLRAFFDAKARRELPEAVKGVLTGLGLEVQSVALRGGALPLRGLRECWLDVRAAVPGDAELCPAPAFGSQAEGRYRVLCVFGPMAEEDLCALASTGQKRTATLVLYFGTLAEARRLELRRLCRERGLVLPVLDEALALYLCGQGAPRLAPLLRCALPFSAPPPLPEAAPELFSGRGVLCRSMLDPGGVNLLYGGRRAGLSAVLRQAERLAQEGGRSLLVRAVDLRAEGIGAARPSAELPALLAERLGRDVGPRLPEWLAEDQRRRVVLLLDGADTLLAADRRDGYAQLDRLRALMERTDQRLKAVLAGGAEVLRLHRAGGPRPHLAVGRRLSGLACAEGNDARALLLRPLSALGLTLGSEELLWQVLARADGDAAQILALSQALIDAAPPGAPPQLLDGAAVARALEAAPLRRLEGERLRGTLEQDPRYRLVAGRLAAYTALRPEALLQGVPLPWLQEDLLAHGPASQIAELGHAALPALLDELVELGVLRRAGEGRHALRDRWQVELLAP